MKKQILRKISFKKMIISLAATTFISSCISTTSYEYKPFVAQLDGKSELEVSTYPAGYGEEKASIPFIYKKTGTNSRLYFRLFVRNKATKFGHNPHVKTVLIKNFTYSLNDQPKKKLLSNYKKMYWTQDDGMYKKPKTPSIPYLADGHLNVEVDLNLNGKNYSVKGKMPAIENTSYDPITHELIR